MLNEMFDSRKVVTNIGMKKDLKILQFQDFFTECLTPEKKFLEPRELPRG